MASRPKASPNDGMEPRYGSRLLPQVVDELARTNPQRIFATIPLSSDLTHGFRDITMLQVSQAVNKCAFWLEDTIGRCTTFETLSYMGLSDLRYAIVFLAAVKCGYKVSTRNRGTSESRMYKTEVCSFFYPLYETPPG